jgi:nucleotide-binding universal stress UspA family protein
MGPSNRHYQNMKKILLPLNGTTHSHKVLAYARKLAERWQAEVVLMRALDPLVFSGENFASLKTKHLEKEMLAAAKDYLNSLTEQFPGLVTRTVCEVGPARETIRAQAYRENCDLIMMAPYAYGQVVRWVIGSVAEEVSHMAPCPVLLVRGECRPEPHHIMVAVDGSQISYSVLDHLQPYLTSGTKVTVLHCCGVAGEEAESSHETRAYLERLELDLERQIRDRSNTRLVILQSHAPEGLLDWLQHSHCDLVAMSTHGNGGFRHLHLGGVTDQLARRAGCPVLVFPPGSGAAGHSAPV